MSEKRSGWLKWEKCLSGIHAVDILLGLIVSGPFLAPIFLYILPPLPSGLSPFPWIGRFIYALGDVICPQPDVSFMLAGHRWAICVGCYGAGIGLIVARWWTQSHHPIALRFQALRWSYRLYLVSVPFAIWAADVRFHISQSFLLLGLNGVWAGLSLGLLVYTLVQVSRAMRRPNISKGAKFGKTFSAWENRF